MELACQLQVEPWILECREYGPLAVLDRLEVFCLRLPIDALDSIKVAMMYS